MSAENIPEGFVSELTTVNGISLHYVRGGEGPPLVLIHGFPQDWFEYQRIMPRLAKHFTVVAVDLRGIGGSKATPGGYDAANLAEDIQQLLKALKLQQASYTVGKTSVLQLIDAQRTYAQARLGLATALIQQYQDAAGLLLALGGAWWKDPLPK